MSSSGHIHFAPLAMAERGVEEQGAEDNHQQNQQHQSTANMRPVRTYKDGFSDSLCDMFADPYDRSSCCALTCCGTFLQDRNQYAMTGEMPPPWWMRILTYSVISIIGPIIIAVTTGSVLLGVGAVFVGFGIRSTILRHALRRRIMGDLLGTYDDPSAETCGGYRSRRAHRLCGCNENDRVDAAFDPLTNDLPRDCCTAFWKTLAALCCGHCCGCWCNFWGMCATAQEHRELRKRLPKEKFQMDYVTMQPYQEYFQNIQKVRSCMDTSLRGHLEAISSLSKWILGLFAGLLVLITLILFFHSSFPLARLLVVGATMGQAIAVLYFVHWRYHRFDLSLDAVIKLFGVGFVFSTGIAIMVELVTILLGYAVFGLVLSVEIAEDDPASLPSQDPTNPMSSVHLMQSIAKRHWLTFVIFLAYQAFVVAGMTEELAKYFCFWMVEHPDYPDPRDDDGEAVREKGLHRTAAAVTVGMVATASGFACAENFMYVFGRGLSLSGEIELLLLRSCLPVHPICAAIQSIGICRRDIEHDGTGLGRAILPAVLLHGIFDFAAFFFSMVAFINKDVPDSATMAPTADPKAPKDLEMPSILSLFLYVGIIAIWSGYYFFASRQQVERLNALNATHDSSLSLALT